MELMVAVAQMYAAVADANVDYPGSCGRCYQVGWQHQQWQWQ